LLDRRRTGSAILGSLPELKSCSSAAPKHFDSKALSDPISRRQRHMGVNLSTLGLLSSLQERQASSCSTAPKDAAAAAGSERNSLPPIFENSRGLVRLPTSPDERERRAKRSRSTTGTTVGQLSSIAEHSTSSKLSSLPALVTSQSTGALATCKNADSDVEQILVTALSGKPGAHKARHESPVEADNIEAHLQELIDCVQDKENAVPKKKKERRAQVRDHHGDNENDIHRKGTGFVHLNSSAEKVKAHRARIVDSHGDNENRLCRKGTGFVHLKDISGKMSEHRAKILDSHGDNENNICRRGTGFVDLSSLPKDSTAVSFPELTGGDCNNIQRRGTGFVVLSHVSPRVRIADDHGDNENQIHRKGTGFVDLSACSCESPKCIPATFSEGSTIDSPSAHQNTSDTDEVSYESDDLETCTSGTEQAALIETL
jgi:hypothetical protein